MQKSGDELSSKEKGWTEHRQGLLTAVTTALSRLGQSLEVSLQVRGQ